MFIRQLASLLAMTPICQNYVEFLSHSIVGMTKNNRVIDE